MGFIEGDDCDGNRIAVNPNHIVSMEEEEGVTKIRLSGGGIIRMQEYLSVILSEIAELNEIPDGT